MSPNAVHPYTPTIPFLETTWYYLDIHPLLKCELPRISISIKGLMQVSQSQHYCIWSQILGQGCGAVLCTVERLAAPLASIHHMAVAHLQAVTTKNVSRYCQMTPGGQKLPFVENHWFPINHDSAQ